ncbi:RHS repeat-associated core domain-containing protein [Neolewinella agarilytica]|uniref:RHS repeat-associated core domain-containing protein n=1 Tax=Neolewinella agarilytica TaxID=478744 RepID=A0A1H9BJI9_9BACT|nr:RHS repeat-associated core domain-containing protein [Neolewinella agarilytica]
MTFYLHDHLGNTRVTFRADSPSDIAIEYAADYYPYGKILREYRPCSPNRYLSTHHERDAETGYDNRGARLYDSELGRFLGVDPLASKFSGWSPYNYVMGNPISLVDPDGMAASDPPIHEAFAFMVAQRNSTSEMNIALSRTHTKTSFSGGRKITETRTSQQLLRTNDRGEILEFSSTWTKSIETEEIKFPNSRTTKTEQGSSTDFSSDGDLQLKQAVRIIEGIHNEGSKQGGQESVLNIVGMSNNPVGSRGDAAKAVATAIVRKTAHPVISTVFSMLVSANGGSDGFNLSNTAVLVDEHMKTGSPVYGVEGSQYQSRPAVSERDGALHDSNINVYEDKD